MARAQKMEGEEQEALFSSYPCTALYYVQSPSTASHANSNTSDCGRNPSTESTLLSPPIFPDTANLSSSRGGIPNRESVSRLALSRYSSSRGSNNSFLHDKKSTASYDLQSQQDSILKSGRLRIVDAGGEEYAGGVDEARRSGLWRYIALDLSSPCFCVGFQILWRFLFSLGAALLVFFLVSKPPPPKVTFKVVGFKHFSLREGVDNTGVATKILSSNCSVDMEIENNSKAFGLHVRSTTLDMDFGHFRLAASHVWGPDHSYVESDSYDILGLFVAVKDRPVYGAGRSMQDMLESGQGLPLMIRMRSRSSYRVVGNLIRPSYHHQEECLLILDCAHDEKHSIYIRNSTCHGT